MDVLSRYRVNHNSSSSEDDSEDSDNECAVWKRATNKKPDVNEHLQNDVMNEEPLDEKEEIEQPQPLPEQPKSGQKRKRNTIWCDVLQDQLISEDLEDCLLNKPRNYGSRGKESYDYTRAYNDEKKRGDSESEMSGCSVNDDSGVDSNSKSQKKRSFFSQNKSKKFVKLNSAEFDAARKINKVLNEKKYYLIQRIVKYVGIEKAMHLLELTKEIEENGGMMIKSQTRRRTPGGVYIQMLKDDKEVTREMLDKIFEGEMSGQEMKKYYDDKKKRKKKKKNFKHSSKGASKWMAEADIEPMEPDAIAPMDAEVIIDRPAEVLNSDVYVPSAPTYVPSSPSYVPSSPSYVPSAPTIDKKSSNDVSDLEEGEIED